MSGDLDKILPAVNEAMKEVDPLAKSNDNKYDNYKFASIDDFLIAVNKILANNGLIVLPPDELEIIDFLKEGRSGSSSWLRYTFQFVLAHVSGQTLPPVKKSVEVMRNGAQASGAAQSYALKQYLRALLLIATGDSDDPDFQGTSSSVVKSKEDDFMTNSNSIEDVNTVTFDNNNENSPKKENEEPENIVNSILSDLESKVKGGQIWVEDDLKNHYESIKDRLADLEFLGRSDLVTKINLKYKDYKENLPNSKQGGNNNAHI